MLVFFFFSLYFLLFVFIFPSPPLSSLPSLPPSPLSFSFTPPSKKKKKKNILSGISSLFLVLYPCCSWNYWQLPSLSSRFSYLSFSLPLSLFVASSCFFILFCSLSRLNSSFFTSSLLPSFFTLFIYLFFIFLFLFNYFYDSYYLIGNSGPVVYPSNTTNLIVSFLPFQLPTPGLSFPFSFLFPPILFFLSFSFSSSRSVFILTIIIILISPELVACSYRFTCTVTISALNFTEIATDSRSIPPPLSFIPPQLIFSFYFPFLSLPFLQTHYLKRRCLLSQS